MSDSVSVVIPTRNEDPASLAALVSHFPYALPVFVVDDSSPPMACPIDGALTAFGPGNLGGSIELGLRLAASQAGDDRRAVVIDAGGSHDPSQAKALLDYPEDIVIGSRFVAGGLHTGPWWRRAGSSIYGRLMAAGTGIPVADWTSGYRVYSRRAMEVIAARSPDARGHAWQAEALARCVDAGCSYVEAPIMYQPSTSSLSLAQCTEAVRVLYRQWFGAGRW